MSDLSLPKYDKPRKWIMESKENGISWDEISMARKKDEASLASFLELQVDMNFCPEMTTDEWKELVKQQKATSEFARKIDFNIGIAHIHDHGEESAVTIPEDKYSSWQLYRSKLLKDGFKEETVDEIERTTIKILKRLNNDTRKSGPVKGLVIGNVQSGKTANMAALMAMAADWGWNMFVILSGTIENLRVQTQNRLFDDLNQQGTIFWRSLEHLSKTVDISMKAQNLHFDPHSKERYFTVCLKNSSRLSKLIQWAQADANKQKQMKILVIDDEADQAGINTAHVDEAERKRINGLICALVNGKNEKGQDIDAEYLAMNYIGYTATPYANILNEAGDESLYPRNFISTLAVSREYFGPQQIFGYAGENEENNFEGMDIVRTISSEELDYIKEVHEGNALTIPESLIDATCWFMCGVACMRIWGYKKPISMLVHTSQKTVHHKMISDVISNWLERTDRAEIIDRVKAVWEIETERFTLADFRAQYPTYDRPDDEINNYPEWNEVLEQVKILLGDGISHIQLGDDGDLSYHKGIHLCIDNCANTGISSDGMHVRLAYPEASKMPEPSPAFIVVGGATLSRGLTIEGLMSTFFIRSVGQADTLMQMGRWFGYRKKYEMLPRVWMTEKTRAQFEFLSALDQELRDEIQYMDINGRSPADYGPKVKNSPKLSFIRITSKNKMQSATDSEMDYSGVSNQTYLFDDDSEILDKNIRTTEEFLDQLGSEWSGNDKYGLRTNAAVWRNVQFEKVKAYIEAFSFQERLSVFNDTKPMLKWLGQMTEQGKLGPWNVVVAGKNDSKNGIWILPNGHEINKVKRTRRISKSEIADSVINIGALRGPRDVLADIDVEAISDAGKKADVIRFIESGSSKAALGFRDLSGLDTTPQLLIYRVDKDSEVSGSNMKLRTDLNAPADLIGICLYIPGGRIGTSYASTVSIKMKNDVFDGAADMEGTDEN